MAWLSPAPARGEAPPLPPPIEVSVRADPVASDPEDVTPAVYAIGREQLEAPGLTLADALETAPGVQVQRSGGDADVALPRLRGGRSAQTPLFLAGIRLDDELTGAVDTSTLPPAVLYRARVYRGHAPRAADAQGIGGAIWLEPKVPRGPAAGTVALGAGSFGGRDARATLTLGGDRVAVASAVGYRRGRGDFTFRDDNGTRFDERDDVDRRRINADHATLDGWSMLRWSGRRHRVTAIVHGLRRDGGAPGLQLPGAQTARLRLSRLLGAVAADVGCAAPWCRLHVASSLLQTTYDLRDPRGELGAPGGAFNRTRGARHRARVVVAPRRDLDLGAGLTWYQSQLHVEGVGARRRVVRPQLDGRWSPRADLDLTVVAAVPCHATRGGDGLDGGEPCGLLVTPTGRVGARYRPHPDIAVFGNAGRYVRVPTLGERFGVSAAVRGNGALGPERGWSTEVGVTARGVSASWAWWVQGVGFGIWSDALIAYRRASVGAVRPFNVGAARSLGVEVVMGASWRRWFVGEVVATALDPRDVTEGRALEADLLPFTAPWVVSPRITMRTPPWAAAGMREARFSSRFRYQAGRVADPAGLVALPAQRLWGLRATVAFVADVDVAVDVSNLLDQRTVDFIGYPLPGRAFFASTSARW